MFFLFNVLIGLLVFIGAGFLLLNLYENKLNIKELKKLNKEYKSKFTKKSINHDRPR